MYAHQFVQARVFLLDQFWLKQEFRSCSSLLTNNNNVAIRKPENLILCTAISASANLCNKAFNKTVL
jgi:hypothetical protein